MIHVRFAELLPVYVSVTIAAARDHTATASR